MARQQILSEPGAKLQQEANIATTVKGNFHVCFTQSTAQHYDTKTVLNRKYNEIEKKNNKSSF